MITPTKSIICWENGLELVSRGLCKLVFRVVTTNPLSLIPYHKTGFYHIVLTRSQIATLETNLGNNDAKLHGKLWMVSAGSEGEKRGDSVFTASSIRVTFSVP